MNEGPLGGCQTPFILITAFGDDEVRAELGRIPNAFMLEKPFARPDLLTWVATALRDRGPPHHDQQSG